MANTPILTNAKPIPSAASNVVRKMAETADRWLDSLSDGQRSEACFPFAGDERYFWHYTPVERNGLMLSQMTAEQQSLAYEMMATGYSASGYAMARQIIELETLLGEWEAINNQASNWQRLEDRYWFSVFGEPGSDDPWGWRVGGHHIGIIATVVNGEDLSLHPLFFGSNPAEVMHGEHKGLRTLAEEEDWARDLVNSMTDDQRRVAIVDPVAPADILTRTYRVTDPTMTPQGIGFTRLDDIQRQRVVDLIRHYVFRASDVAAENYWNHIEKSGWDSVYFAWAGPLERWQGHYYNIRHDRFVIEYDNTQNGANHIHSVLRDYAHDFGEDLLAAHYRHAH